jgi:hypothetical protein
MINREIINALNITIESDRLRLIPLVADRAQLLFSAMQDRSTIGFRPRHQSVL